MTRTKSSNAVTHAVATESGVPVIERLVDAYNAELETLMNYIANAANLDGVRAETIRTALESDVPTELGHAQRLARRIRTLGGMVPGSQKLQWEQAFLQPPRHSTDVVAVIEGVIRAEEQAIELYQGIIEACEGTDYVTQDMVIEILADEQEHRREFAGFLKEYKSSRDGAAG